MEKETVLSRIKTVRKATFFSIGKVKNLGKGITEESNITIRLGVTPIVLVDGVESIIEKYEA